MSCSVEERSYEPLCLEAIFGDQLLDICLEKTPPGEGSPFVIASVDDDVHAAKYASLFRASPDLLQALRGAADILAILAARGTAPAIDQPELIAALTAIEKAEGRA
jgi:hypothetical protein